MAKAKAKPKPTRKRKQPHVSHFGRCTAKERAACTVCTDKGKQLCAAAAASHDQARSPRRSGKGDERPFTPMVHEAVRWSLGRDFDGVYKTYVYLLSQTSADTLLVYRSAKHLAAGRDLSPKTFSDHVGKLVDLKLIEKLPRSEVTAVGGRAFDAYLVLPLPKWALHVGQLLEKISSGRLRPSELKRAKTALRGAQRRTLVHYENVRKKRGRGERTARKARTRK